MITVSVTDGPGDPRDVKLTVEMMKAIGLWDDVHKCGNKDTRIVIKLKKKGDGSIPIPCVVSEEEEAQRHGFGRKASEKQARVYVPTVRHDANSSRGIHCIIHCGIHCITHFLR